MNAHNRISQHVQKFNRMDVGELALFLRAWVTQTIWWFRVRLGAIPDSATAASSLQPVVRQTDKALIQIRSCQLAVQRAENYHWLGGNCLIRSLTLQSLLIAYGIESRLRLGVRPDSNRMIEAHAWLEVGELELGRSVPGEAAYDQLGRNP